MKLHRLSRHSALKNAKIEITPVQIANAAFCAFFLWNALPVHSQVQFDFVKIADTTTPIPGGTGNFTSFTVPANNGSTIAFWGAGSGGQQGIYKSTGGVLSRVMDRTTPVPDSFPSDSFVSIDIPSARGTSVVFWARSMSQEGIYRSDGGALEIIAHKGTPIPSSGVSFDRFSVRVAASGGLTAFNGGTAFEAGIYLENGSGLIRVADLTMPLPSGTGNFTGFASPALDGNTVTVRGLGGNNQHGIYSGTAGNLVRVADKSTAIPSGSGTFATFSDPCVSGSNVAFRATGTNGQVGIYLQTSGALLRVVDTNTMIPGGIGRFTAFSPPSLEGENMAFGAGSVMFSQGGIYLYRKADGALHKIVDKNTVLEGKQVSQLSLHPEGMRSGSIVFSVTFVDGIIGIWKAIMPTPYQPALRIEAVAPASIRVFWPTNDPGFSLQFSTNHTVTNWTPTSPGPITFGTDYVVTNSTLGAQRFYRLFKP